MKWLCLLLLAFCSGCALFGDYRMQNFDTGKYGVVKLRVPKGYSKKKAETDSAGNRSLVFSYPYQEQLYFSTDTSLSYFIDTAQHIWRPHYPYGRFYKGMLPGAFFWREVYSQGLKYGYRNVVREEEPLFDSSLNYVRVR